MRPRGSRTALVAPWLLVALAAVSCAGTHPVPHAVPEPPAAEIETTLLLLGDAGDPDPRGEPVLRALASELSRAPSRSLAAFLGDNVYPRGLPEPASPNRAEAERKLAAQVDAVSGAGARGLFVPGNHDWDRQGDGGWDAIRREARYVEERGGPAVAFLPKDGCPGPAVRDVGRGLRLVILDTQWWLHRGPKPRDSTSGCPEYSEEQVARSLRSALAGAGGRKVAVLAHHPLDSGGGHGGHFSWKDHVFPLRAWQSWLWLPLPAIGSIYPLSRKAGVFSQDMPSAAYRHMLEAFEAALAPNPPLLWACGHDHGLQVLRGTSARHLLVSGAGNYGHTQTPLWIDAMLFRSGEAGIMRLDVGRDGRIRLGVLTVDRSGRATERYSADLD